MHTCHRRLWALVTVIMAAAAILADAQARGAVRTVYVVAVDQQGAPVADLIATDLRIEEAGADCEVLRVEPSRSRLKVALAVDESLTPGNLVRQALAGFIDQVHEHGELALYVIGQRNEKRVDYTSDIMPFVRAINAFPIKTVYEANLVEGIEEIAREQRSHEGRRVIITVATEISQRSSVTAEGVLEQLRNGRTVFYAATLAGFEIASQPLDATSGGRRLALENQVAGLERDRLFSDGTRQSGGLHLSVVRAGAFPAALARIAGELRHQYAVSYVVPAGSKANGRVSIVANRKGITVRGPSHVAER